jgi:hypothetical protein
VWHPLYVSESAAGVLSAVSAAEQWLADTCCIIRRQKSIYWTLIHFAFCKRLHALRTGGGMDVRCRRAGAVLCALQCLHYMACNLIALASFQQLLAPAMHEAALL